MRSIQLAVWNLPLDVEVWKVVPGQICSLPILLVSLIVDANFANLFRLRAFKLWSIDLVCLFSPCLADTLDSDSS